MTHLSGFPDHIRLPLCAVIEPVECTDYYRFHPKFIKWLTVARFKYDKPDVIKQLADYLCKGYVYPYGMTLNIDTSDIRCASFIYRFFCHFSAVFRMVDLLCDYLAACDLHYDSITLENVSFGVYDLKFTFTESPT